MVQTLIPEVEVVTAGCGAEALGILRAGQLDLVLLDITLPDIDGWEVIGTIKRDEMIEELPPTYFVSAQDPDRDPPVTRYFAAVMDDGFSINKLLRCSLNVASLLMKPERELAPVPG
jgi:CheY-like chemotaxis protein